VKILISLQATDRPSAGSGCFPPGLPPGLEDGEELLFTGWLGLLRVLREVMGSAAVTARNTKV